MYYVPWYCRFGWRGLFSTEARASVRHFNLRLAEKRQSQASPSSGCVPKTKLALDRPTKMWSVQHFAFLAGRGTQGAWGWARPAVAQHTFLTQSAR